MDTIKANPAVLNTPDLKFMKDFIEGFGGKVPDAKPPGTPSGGGHGHGHGNAVRFGLRFRRTSEPRLTRGFGCAEGVRRRARLLRRGRQLLPRPRQGRGRPRPRPRARRRQGGGCQVPRHKGRVGRLPRGRREVRQGGHRRLYRGVVRPVQADRPEVRGHRGQDARRGLRQGRRRQERGGCEGVRHQVHAHLPGLPRREEGRRDVGQ